MPRTNASCDDPPKVGGQEAGLCWDQQNQSKFCFGTGGRICLSVYWLVAQAHLMTTLHQAGDCDLQQGLTAVALMSWTALLMIMRSLREQLAHEQCCIRPPLKWKLAACIGHQRRKPPLLPAVLGYRRDGACLLRSCAVHLCSSRWP